MSNALRFVGEKILRIPLSTEGKESYQDRVTRGESIISAHDTVNYVDKEADVGEWLRGRVPSKQQWKEYGLSLFPFVDWIPRYNLIWLTGDLVAGITVGAVVVPQGMAEDTVFTIPVPQTDSDLTRHGVRSDCSTSRSIWFVLLLCRSYDLLAVCNLKRVSGGK